MVQDNLHVGERALRGTDNVGIGRGKNKIVLEIRWKDNLPET